MAECAGPAAGCRGCRQLREGVTRPRRQLEQLLVQPLHGVGVHRDGPECREILVLRVAEQAVVGGDALEPPFFVARQLDADGPVLAVPAQRFGPQHANLFKTGAGQREQGDDDAVLRLERPVVENRRQEGAQLVQLQRSSPDAQLCPLHLAWPEFPYCPEGLVGRVTLDQAGQGREVTVGGVGMQSAQARVVGPDVRRGHVLHRLALQHGRHRADHGEGLALRGISGGAAGKPLLVALGEGRSAEAGQRQQLRARRHGMVARGQPPGNFREGLSKAQQFDIDRANQRQRRLSRPGPQQAAVIGTCHEHSRGRWPRVVFGDERPHRVRIVAPGPLQLRPRIGRELLATQAPVDFVEGLGTNGRCDPAGDVGVNDQGGPLCAVGLAEEDRAFDSFRRRRRK